MSIELLKGFFGWCALVNYLVLLIWFLMFCCARDWVYQIHSRWFRIEQSSFDRIHYCGMGLFKLLWFIFNLVPYLALLVIS